MAITKQTLNLYELFVSLNDWKHLFDTQSHLCDTHVTDWHCVKIRGFPYYEILLLFCKRIFGIICLIVCCLLIWLDSFIFSYTLAYLMNHAIFECRTGLLTLPQVTEQGENHQPFILNALHFQGRKHPKAKWYSESCSKLKIPHFRKLFSIVIVCIKTGEKNHKSGGIYGKLA